MLDTRKVRAIDNMAYELELPPHMGKLHNVFHPWLLHLHEERPLPTQTRDEEEPGQLADPDAEDDTNYKVEAILESRVNRRLLQYLVRWTNYPEGPDNPSWEPYMNLADCADLVHDFH